MQCSQLGVKYDEAYFSFWPHYDTSPDFSVGSHRFAPAAAPAVWETSKHQEITVGLKKGVHSPLSSTETSLQAQFWGRDISLGDPEPEQLQQQFLTQLHKDHAQQRTPAVSKTWKISRGMLIVEK